jgi:hypothetical protein
VRVEHPEVMLRVCDTGVGISAAMLPYVLISSCRPTIRWIGRKVASKLG